LYAWDDQITHKALTEQAALKSVLHRSYGNYLPNIGFFDIDEILHWDNKACDDETGETECTIKEWLRYGAEKEDEERWFTLIDFSLRFLNHFHNPLCDDSSCDFGGLNDGLIPAFSHGQSALLWAQDDVSQAREVEGDQSWNKVRTLFYQALTSVNDTERQSRFAQMFKGLGHQMHLVQDMAVPAHVRNDAHPEYQWGRDRNQWADAPKLPLFFEPWAKDKSNQAKITAFAANAQKPILDFSTPYLGDLFTIPMILMCWARDITVAGMVNQLGVREIVRISW